MFVILAPTLLFLGLVRGLERLRDDAFLIEWASAQDKEPEELVTDDVLAVLAGGVGIGADESETGHCPSCGVTNRSEMAYCQECLTPLN